MRNLVLMRGSMGSGKSTFIKNNNLQQYTLSADGIRLLIQSPILSENGNYTISQKNDNKVWEFLLQLLEERMKRGEFTIVDATHAKQESISRYKKLAQEYRYRVSVIDFSDVPLNKLLEQNKMRPEYKQVPEIAIMNSYERMKTEHVPKWTTLIKPQEYNEIMQYRPIDLSDWKKIHVIGDIHGCYTALMEYLKDGLKDDELYIFTGDYLDRGLENDKVLQFLVEIKDNENIMLLEGNHEYHIKNWSHERETDSRVFKNSTEPQLEKANIDKKEVRQLYRRLRQLVYFTYHGKTFVITHGGISKMPDNFIYLATEQLIKGVGDYNTDIDYAWEQNTNGNENLIQIHGHRNIFRLPTAASKNSYNLEGGVERGGDLRVVTLTKEGIQTHEIKNNIFKISKDVKPSVDQNNMSMDEFILYLQNHQQIKEKQLGHNISSFNFTRKAFKEKIWDDINIKARGLFINTYTKDVVSRSYDKFFNTNERSFTKIPALADNLKFPVKVYEKVNGYLGTVGYNSETDQLIFTSKSEINSEHANWLKELFYDTFNENTIKLIKSYIKQENVSLVFEVILPKENPHIIEYKERKLVLLDIVYREIVFKRKDYRDLEYFAKAIGVEYKRLAYIFSNWIDFYKWYRDITNDWSIEKEGYVVEDSAGFMIKIKLPYYNFWKQMRGIKDKVARKQEHTIKGSELYTPLHNKFFAWLKTKDREYVKKSNIIQLRNDFYNEMDNL
ncbi:RNA ligase [Caldifermentibacillus hisashii]|uniref:RNA ligase n=1 Tax=Caldifermentibacillus hisashii TaxID=996558 RepID=A0ABU9K349_9BACI